MNKHLKILTGLLISGVFLSLVFKNFNIAEFLASVKGASWAWLPVVIVLVLIGHSLRALRWSILLKPIKSISPVKLFFLLVFGFLMNNMLPVRMGEIVRAMAARRTTGIETGSVLGSIALERFGDLFGLIVVLTFASRLVPLDRLPMSRVAVVLIVGVAAAAVFLKFFRRHRSMETSPHGFTARIRRFLEDVAKGLTALKSWKKVAAVILCSIAVWLMEATVVLAFSNFLHLNFNFLASATFLIGISLGVMIPSGPAFVGTYEFFGKQALMLLGYDAQPALSFVLAFHLFTFVFSSLLGLTGFFALKLGPKQ